MQFKTANKINGFKPISHGMAVESFGSHSSDAFEGHRKTATRDSASESWCAREDLNLQPLRDQILSLARLPFRHARNRHQLAPCTAESQAFVAVLCTDENNNGHTTCYSARLHKPEGLFRFMSCHFGSGWWAVPALCGSPSR